MKYNFEIKDAAELKQVIYNNGWHPASDPSTDSPLTIKDAITSSQLGPLIPHAVTEIMVEAADPMMTLTGLLDRIPTPMGTQEFKMPAVGVFDIERIGEGEAYPEKKLNIGGALNTATIDKWGVALAFTEEAITYSRWDLVGMHTRAAGRAFGVRREKGAADHLRSLGKPIFDNRRPTLSERGVTGGRDASMAGNGTLTLDDLFEMYASVLHQGYNPDLLILHPLTWLMFIKDPNLRAFAFQNGGGSVFGGFNGSPVNRFIRPDGTETTIARGSRNGVLGRPVNGDPAADVKTDFSNNLNASPQIPSLFPWSMNIVVSPWLYYDPSTRLTDVVMADSSTLGAMCVAEDLTTDSWDELKTDLRYMKFRERYGFMIYEEGMGIAVARNVRVDQNHMSLEPARPMYDPTVAGLLNPLTPTV